MGADQLFGTKGFCPGGTQHLSQDTIVLWVLKNCVEGWGQTQNQHSFLEFRLLLSWWSTGPDWKLPLLWAVLTLQLPWSHLMFPNCCCCLELRIGSTAVELHFWLLQAGFPVQRDSVMHFFCNISILVNLICRVSSLLPQLNPSILISKYWQLYPIDYPPVGRCVGCLLQGVAVWCQIYFCFIFQASRIDVEALVSSTLRYA